MVDPKAKGNAQAPDQQLNTQNVVDELAAQGPGISPNPEQPDHSMFDEEPDGWDQAPLTIRDPRHKRHPRHEGKGGTP